MFQVEVYETEQPFAGDRAAALNVALTALLGHGFEILSKTSDEIQAVGPRMNSSNQPALAGATTITIRVSSSAIQARAELGGVRTLKRFLYLVPLAMGVLLLIVFLPLAGAVAWTSLLSVAPVVILAPFLVGWIERRSAHAVDRLVRSMVAVGGAGTRS